MSTRLPAYCTRNAVEGATTENQQEAFHTATDLIYETANHRCD